MPPPSGYCGTVAEDRLDHAAHLSPVWLALDGSAAGMATLALALFLVGLTGGATHCTAMCGPFVLAQLPGRRIDRPSARAMGG
jgi:hypothetical protein